MMPIWTFIWRQSHDHTGSLMSWFVKETLTFRKDTVWFFRADLSAEDVGGHVLVKMVRRMNNVISPRGRHSRKLIKVFPECAQLLILTFGPAVWIIWRGVERVAQQHGHSSVLENELYCLIRITSASVYGEVFLPVSQLSEIPLKISLNFPPYSDYIARSWASLHRF